MPVTRACIRGASIGDVLMRVPLACKGVPEGGLPDSGALSVSLGAHLPGAPWPGCRRSGRRDEQHVLAGRDTPQVEVTIR